MATTHRPFQAFGLAVLLEIILLTAAGILLTGSTIIPPVPEPVTITLLNEEKPPVKPPEKPPEPKPLPKPKMMLPKRPAIPPPPRVTPPVQTVPVAQAPTAFTQPAPPPPAPAPAPVPDNSKARASDLYAAKVHAAVQAAHYYPPAAAALRYTGRVRVEFHLRDAIPGEARLVVSSGIGMIDRAALSAVQNAHYPPPPSELRGDDLIYEVWVEFNRQP